jgi:hypothetical protein
MYKTKNFSKVFGIALIFLAVFSSILIPGCNDPNSNLSYSECCFQNESLDHYTCKIKTKPNGDPVLDSEGNTTLQGCGPCVKLDPSANPYDSGGNLLEMIECENNCNFKKVNCTNEDERYSCYLLNETTNKNALDARGNPILVAPICSAHEPDPCIQNECSAMAFGEPVPDPRKMLRAEDIDKASDEDGSALGEDDTVQGLVSKAFEISALDEDLTKKLRSGDWSINSLRLGMQGSFADYDEARFYLPPSDFYCGPINTQSIVDRYLYYMDADGTALDTFTSPSLNYKKKLSLCEYDDETINGILDTPGIADDFYYCTDPTITTKKYYTGGTDEGANYAFLTCSQECNFALFKGCGENVELIKNTTDIAPPNQDEQEITVVDWRAYADQFSTAYPDPEDYYTPCEDPLDPRNYYKCQDDDFAKDLQTRLDALPSEPTEEQRQTIISDLLNELKGSLLKRGAPGSKVFECETGSDCLSGICDKGEYSRSTCFLDDGTPVPCDCKYVIDCKQEFMCEGIASKKDKLKCEASKRACLEIFPGEEPGLRLMCKYTHSYTPASNPYHSCGKNLDDDEQWFYEYHTENPYCDGVGGSNGGCGGTTPAWCAYPDVTYEITKMDCGGWKDKGCGYPNVNAFYMVNSDGKAEDKSRIAHRTGASYEEHVKPIELLQRMNAVADLRCIIPEAEGEDNCNKPALVAGICDNSACTASMNDCTVRADSSSGEWVCKVTYKDKQGKTQQFTTTTGLTTECTGIEKECSDWKMAGDAFDNLHKEWFQSFDVAPEWQGVMGGDGVGYIYTHEYVTWRNDDCSLSLSGLKENGDKCPEEEIKFPFVHYCELTTRDHGTSEVLRTVDFNDVANGVQSDDIFIAPEITGQGYNNKKWKVVGSGKCQDGDDTTPLVRTYGICQPCGSFISMAYQKVDEWEKKDSMNSYCPEQCERKNLIYRQVIDGGTFEVEVPASAGQKCLCDYAPQDGFVIGVESGVATDPNFGYIFSKVHEYQSNMIMPILDLTDYGLEVPTTTKITADEEQACKVLGADEIVQKKKSCGFLNLFSCPYYECTFAAKYDILLEVLQNKHSSVILLTDKLDEGAAGEDIEDVKDRISVVKETCPDCLVGIEYNKLLIPEDIRNDVDNPYYDTGLADILKGYSVDKARGLDGVEFDPERMEPPTQWNDGEPEDMQNVDVIFLDVDFGKIDTTNNITIENDLKTFANLSKNLLKHVGKPSVWMIKYDENRDKLKDELIYKTMYKIEKEIALSGIISIMLPPLRDDNTPDDFDESLLAGSEDVYDENTPFCAVQQSSVYYLAPEVRASLKRIIAKDDCYCKDCNRLEKSTGACMPNQAYTLCVDGLQCTAQDGLEPNSVGVKCQEDCIRKSDAKLCNSSANIDKEIICTALSPLGETPRECTISASGYPDLEQFPDNCESITIKKGILADEILFPYAPSIIAGLPNSEICFIEQGSQTYTYRSDYVITRGAESAIFPSFGANTTDCAQFPGDPDNNLLSTCSDTSRMENPVNDKIWVCTPTS